MSDDAAEWDQAEALWWAAVKVRGYVSAYCDAACDAMNALDEAVDELCAARKKAEDALARVNASTERAEAFSKLAARVIDRPGALLAAAEALDALPLRRRRRAA